ncbi:hypothetical protein DUNSADRAFT_16599 [Dunaliella salina]|uniref:Uncharacterized protein n=1 Tax=Dunaliella salina TaxID=3046 RepID=A0ABQ7G3A0_DUNSA|nr:hypothetical protein DUNSADRAFT_16599 [Dunaliella salina]|eukprot:KAF5829086.1 hypothetical protein DUNSADRAFT_16599 [Dunaliella salina]
MGSWHALPRPCPWHCVQEPAAKGVQKRRRLGIVSMLYNGDRAESRISKLHWRPISLQQQGISKVAAQGRSKLFNEHHGAKALSSARDTQDQAFAQFFGRLREVHGEQQVISTEAWDKLFGKVVAPEHAHASLELMRADATVRDQTGWDWSSRGYGQILLRLVEVGASVGAPELAECVIQPALAQELRLNLKSKDFVATIMRKVSAGAPTELLQRLYQAEHSMRGTNTHMAAHELSRRYRKEGNVAGVQQLLLQAQSGDAALKEKLQEDLAIWLQKRQF